MGFFGLCQMVGKGPMRERERDREKEKERKKLI